jgi:uncharacterized protein YdbL (DUF1318 family)
VTAAILKDWIDLVVRVIIIIGLTLFIVTPERFPLLKFFVVTHGKVNILGSEVEFVQNPALNGVLKLKDNNLFLGVDNINDIPDKIARLQSGNESLTNVNQNLSKQLGETQDLLKEISRQRDDAFQQLAQLQHGNLESSLKSPQISDKKIEEQLQENQKSIKYSESIAPTSEHAQTQSVESMTFGVVFSSDTKSDEAMTEINKARTKEVLKKSNITLFKRGKYLASLALFPTREAAAVGLAAIQSLGEWKGPYIVDLHTWCPAALTTSLSSGSEMIDCGF